MTTNKPLMPFFVPAVAGVGLLGPITAVGSHELARRRVGRTTPTGAIFSRFFSSGPPADDIGIVAGLLLVIFALWLSRCRRALFRSVRLDGARVNRQFLDGDLHNRARGWALIVLGGAIGAIFGWFVCWPSVSLRPLCLSIAILVLRRPYLASWRASRKNRREMIRWGLIVLAGPWCSARSRCLSDWPLSCRGSAIRPGTSTRA